MNALPVVNPSRLGEIADDLPVEQLAAAFLAVAHPWELGFLEDMKDAAARKDARAYQMSFEGERGPLCVDHHPGGGHILSMDATRQFNRLRLVEYSWSLCDGACGLDDDDDEWPSSPGECTCADVEPSISLSERGAAIVAAGKARAA